LIDPGENENDCDFESRNCGRVSGGAGAVNVRGCFGETGGEVPFREYGGEGVRAGEACRCGEFRW